MTLLDANIVIVSPEVTHPQVISSRQVHAMFCYLEPNVTNCMKENCLSFHFQECASHLDYACSSMLLCTAVAMSIQYRVAFPLLSIPNNF